MKASIKSIMRREFLSYFVSPIAYIFIGVFAAFVGSFFFKDYFLYQTVSMGNFFGNIPLALGFVIPAITMKSFSEEFRSGSYEILKTLPLRSQEIVLGKFLGNALFGLCLFVPTFFYPISISFTGELAAGPVIGGYIASAFLVFQFTALGIFASAITKNQIVGYIIGLAITLPLAILNQLLPLLPTFLQGFVGYISVGSHFDAIVRGVLDFRDILYFCVMTLLGLTLTYFVIEK